MRFVRFKGFSHTNRYRSATQPEWRAGEVRHVSDTDAAYLLSTFPGAFDVPGEVAASPKRAAMESAPVVKAPEPKKRKTTRRRKTDAKG